MMVELSIWDSTQWYQDLNRRTAKYNMKGYLMKELLNYCMGVAWVFDTTKLFNPTPTFLCGSGIPAVPTWLYDYYQEEILDVIPRLLWLFLAVFCVAFIIMAHNYTQYFCIFMKQYFNMEAIWWFFTHFWNNFVVVREIHKKRKWLLCHKNITFIIWADTTPMH